jgi:hypothetical protein
MNSYGPSVHLYRLPETTFVTDAIPEYGPINEDGNDAIISFLNPTNTPAVTNCVTTDPIAKSAVEVPSCPVVVTVNMLPLLAVHTR